MRVMAGVIARRRTITKEKRGLYMQAFNMLRTGKFSHREIARRCRIPKSTWMHIGASLQSIKLDQAIPDEIMQAFLPNSVGRPTVLTLEEENMIVKRITFAAERGFALTVPALKTIIAKIAAGGRPGWLSRLPCDDAVRSFRARHHEITFRNSENKDSAKLKGESFEHVLSYVTALKQVDTVHPGIFRNADRL